MSKQIKKFRNYSKTCHSRKEEIEAMKRFESKGWKFGGVRTYNGTTSKFHSLLFFHKPLTKSESTIKLII